MSRSAQPRAGGLAEPLLSAVGRTTTVEQALTLLARNPGAGAVVVGRDPPLGGLTVQELRRAQRAGLAGLRLSRLLVGELRQVGPETTLKGVTEALTASPAPFVIVRSRASGTAGYIDRRILASPWGDAETWRPFPSIGSAERGRRGRSALRQHVSPVAISALEELGLRARRAGTRACLVGGVVRDLLLDRPTRDLDVAVEGDPEPLIRGLGLSSTIHSRFRTASVTLEDGTNLDVARTRSERYPRPAALPVVSPAPIEEDSSRRDFTINTLAFSLDPRCFGRILDLHGGVDDLRRGQVRVLHGLSFIDDPTRGFRAVRLAARLGFAIEARTASLLRLAEQRGSFGHLSPTRLRREVATLLAAPDFPVTLPSAARHGLLGALHPRLRLSPRARATLARSAAAIEWYEALARAEPIHRWLVPLGLLLGGLDAQAAGELLGRLAPRRGELRLLEGAHAGVAELVAELCGLHRPAPSEVHAVCRNRQVELLLMALAAAPRAAVRRAIRQHLSAWRGTRLEIDGRDLLREGVPPGPAVAIGLEAALKAKLDGAAGTRAEQLRLAVLAANSPTGAA